MAARPERTAAVVGDALEAAGVAAFDVPAECGGAAVLDGAHHFAVEGRQTMRAPVCLAEEGEDVGDFPAGAAG